MSSPHRKQQKDRATHPPFLHGLSFINPTNISNTVPHSPNAGSDGDPLSPDATDRVFPIRSVVGIDSSRQLTGSIYSTSRGGSEGRGGPLSDSGMLTNDSSSIRGSRDGVATLNRGATDMAPGEEAPIMTQRFQYQQTNEGFMVVTGIAGTEQLQRCEDEPIHCPGAIQSFGALLVLKMDATNENILAVRVASENCEKIIGYTPRQLFELPTFTRLLSDEQAENLLDHIDFIRDDDCDIMQAGPEVFSMIVTGRDALQIKLWCAVHQARHDPSLVICEFELEDDTINPIAAQDELTPPEPEDTLNANLTAEELAESTTSLSKPLRVLRHARRQRGEAAAMEVFSIMSQIQEQLSSAETLESFLKILVGVVKELTGFHRVMIYQFDESWNGRVVTELVDYRATKDLYKGLNFPASDIPKQARDLYKINKVRLLYDRDLETSRLVCRSHEDLETPLDMTHAYLRAMSPIHLKYLKNMSVRASMSISITAFGELWGLVSCHTYGQRGMRVSFPLRKLCRLIGETASRNIERLTYASRLRSRKLINTVPTESNPSGYIVASSDDLLRLFDADFGILSIRDETKVMGNLDDSQEALALLEYLKMRNFGTVVMSQHIASTFPDLKYAPGFKTIAGALIVPLSSEGKDFIVFFRKSQLKQVHWAGNPYDKQEKDGTEAFLEPRKSFKLWSETVVGKSREWTEEELETAAVLCLVYSKFIEVWRQKEAALQSSQLTRILLANASHEVRTPLNAIINYLEIALEGSLDPETRENLTKSHSASKSLIYVINDLLDLTRTEEGHDLIKDELFDLPTTIKEATEMFRTDATRKGLTFEVVQYTGFPQFVKGDQNKIRQAVANIAANAVSHTTAGGIQVELFLSGIVGNKCEVEISVQDTGSGMSSKKLDLLFRELEQVQSDQREEMNVNESQTAFMQAFPGRDSEYKPTLGLGLAVVARIIKNMNGQLRLKSEEGKGSRFTIQMTFLVPDIVPDILESSARAPTMPTISSITPPGEVAAEVTLVQKAFATPERPTLSKRESIESINSIKSAKSNMSGQSNKSEVDRLINAIQSPLGALPASTTSDNNRAILRPGSYEGSTSIQVFRGSDRKTRSEPENRTFGLAMRPIKLPDDGLPTEEEMEAHRERVNIGELHKQQRLLNESTLDQISVASSSSPAVRSGHAEARKSLPVSCGELFSVLVAEDDPVNSKIIKKRLEKMGHRVHLTVNGEACATAFQEHGEEYDAVLMDIQMPIMDGYSSTIRIRKTESNNSFPLPSRYKNNGRIPIFAVSASLVEDKRQEYIDLGFDGWILKPVDFKRLNILMHGIVDRMLRKEAEYEKGEWEKGGWFHGERTEPPLSPADAKTNAVSEVQAHGEPDGQVVGVMQPRTETEPQTKATPAEEDQVRT